MWEELRKLQNELRLDVYSDPTCPLKPRCIPLGTWFHKVRTAVLAHVRRQLPVWPVPRVLGEVLDFETFSDNAAG